MRTFHFARVAALVSALVALAACSASDLANIATSRSGYETVETVRYGSDPRQAFDLYRPAAPRAGAPTVAFFYGGNWSSGARGDYRFVAQALASEGFPVAVVDYRLYPQVVFPAFVEDGARAVAALAERSPGGIALMGHSAGAQIAALLAYDERYLARAGLRRCRIRGFVGLSGPYDFLPLTQPRFKAVFPERTRAASQPIAFVGAGEPRALLATGTDDTTVEPRNSEAMAAALRKVGVPVALEFYGGLDHIDTIAAFAGPFRGRPVLPDTLAFLRSLPAATCR